MAEARKGWVPSRLTKMVRNTVYVGRHVIDAKSGPVVRPAPAIVDPDIWRRAGEQLATNRTLVLTGHKGILLQVFSGG